MRVFSAARYPDCISLTHGMTAPANGEVQKTMKSFNTVDRPLTEFADIDWCLRDEWVALPEFTGLYWKIPEVLAQVWQVGREGRRAVRKRTTEHQEPR